MAGLLLRSLADFEQLGATDRADTRGRRFAILHRCWLRVFHLSFLFALHAVRFHLEHLLGNEYVFVPRRLFEFLPLCGRFPCFCEK